MLKLLDLESQATKAGWWMVLCSRYDKQIIFHLPIRFLFKVRLSKWLLVKWAVWTHFKHLKWQDSNHLEEPTCQERSSSLRRAASIKGLANTNMISCSHRAAKTICSASIWSPCAFRCTEHWEFRRPAQDRR